MAKFLSELYDEDIAAERAEREQLIVKAREWYTSKHAVPPPLPVTGKTQAIGNDEGDQADSGSDQERPTTSPSARSARRCSRFPSRPGACATSG